MTIRILPYQPRYEQAVLDLSIRAWTPVFEKFEPAVPDYVFRAFYPGGWQARQVADIRDYLAGSTDNVLVACDGEQVVGWVGIRLHPEDRMGEIYILAVDPAHQRQGIARSLMDQALGRMVSAGMDIVMVETGDDPGHHPSRSTYESVGFERWPVARYFRKLR